ncbi:MAG: hypothetical protein ABIF19_10325 [Planctomycetota bacterium]
METNGESINILGIETSCDETAAAEVADGRMDEIKNAASLQR